MHVQSHDQASCGAAADDGQLVMLERLAALLRTDSVQAQQQLQQELAGLHSLSPLTDT